MRAELEWGNIVEVSLSLLSDFQAQRGLHYIPGEEDHWEAAWREGAAPPLSRWVEYTLSLTHTLLVLCFTTFHVQLVSNHSEML